MDIHVHRMSNLMSWSFSENVNTTQKQLESWMPKEKWGIINIALASLAQIFLESLGTYRNLILDYSLKMNLSIDTIQMLSWVYNTRNKIFKEDSVI